MITEKNPSLDRLEGILKIVDQAYVKPEELMAVLEAFKSILAELKQQLGGDISNVKAEAETAVREIAYTLNELELKVKGLINNSEATSLAKIKELSQRLTTEITRVEQSIPMETDLSSLEMKITQVEAEIPKIPEPLTPKEVRDKLETLKDEERLDVSAIKGFSKRISKMSDEILNRAIGILDQRTSFLIQRVSNLSDRVDRLPVSTGGGGVGSWSTPPESPDGNITVFTVGSSAPTDVVSDGVMVFTPDYSFNAGQITFINPPTNLVRYKTSSTNTWSTPPESPDGTTTIFTAGSSAPTDVVSDGILMFIPDYSFDSGQITFINPPVDNVRYR